jgi:MFS family permease
MIRRVGHVRVFAALGSFISAALILFPVFTDPYVWSLLRILIGFCFAGVYVTAESWLNNSSTNETRGSAMAIYGVVLTGGIVIAQWLVSQGDASGYILFILPSILVSIAFAPILLSVTPAPAYEAGKAMSFRDVFRASPLGLVGMTLMGGVYSALFGMASVYGTEIGLSVGRLSTFIATLYLGGLILQFPVGWISDRMDRRVLICILAGIGSTGAVLAGLGVGGYPGLIFSSFLIGGAANPLYGLLIAYTNDYLTPQDMAAAAGRLVFANGLGAVAGPVFTGWLMGQVGPQGFFVFVFGLMAILCAYALYRMTRRASTPVDELGSYQAITPNSSPLAVAMAQEAAIDAAEVALDAAQSRPTAA